MDRIYWGLTGDTLDPRGAGSYISPALPGADERQPGLDVVNLPIGSASTLVAVTIIHKNDLAMSFGRFDRLAIPFYGVADRPGCGVRPAGLVVG